MKGIRLASAQRMAGTGRLLLVVLGVALLAGAVGAPATRSATPFTLDWSMPDRFGGDGNGDSLLDYFPPDGSLTIDPGGWRVDLTVSGANCGGSSTRTWWIEGVPVVAGDPRLLAGDPSGCSLSYRFPSEGVYEVAFEERDGNGTLLGSVKKAISVQDFLIVSIGDSVASGEGNPDIPGGNGVWENRQCHRSASAGPAQAALGIERGDPHTSVTFIHLACSGATINEGLLGPYAGIEPTGTLLRPQLDQLTSLVGNREVDALFVSIGANDAHFSQIVQDCLLKSDCNDASKPGSAAQHFAQDSGRLPNFYDQLGTALDAIPLPGDRVYLTEYFDPTHDDTGTICDGTILNDFFANTPVPNPGLKITATEAQWASTTVVGGLNQIGAAAAARHSWHQVTGITSQFLTHGYCANQHWVVRILESLADQGDKNGSLHPNEAGHAVYASQLAATAHTDLYPGGGQTPRRPFQRLQLQGEGPNDSSFGDIVANVQPNATVQLRAQLNGKDTAFKGVAYTLQGPGSLSATSGTTDSTGQASFTYTGPTSQSGCNDGPVCAVITASFTDADGLHTDSLTVGLNPIKVTVSPPSVTLHPGQQATFTASVTGSTNSNVTWTATGGTITQNGLYTAGSTAGTFTVTARSVEDTAATGSATVTIQGCASNCRPGPGYSDSLSASIFANFGDNCSSYAEQLYPYNWTGTIGGVQLTISPRQQGDGFWTFGVSGHLEGPCTYAGYEYRHSFYFFASTKVTLSGTVTGNASVSLCRMTSSGSCVETIARLSTTYTAPGGDVEGSPPLNVGTPLTLNAGTFYMLETGSSGVPSVSHSFDWTFQIGPNP